MRLESLENRRLLSISTLSFAPPTSFAASTNINDPQLVDVNGDGVPDLVYVNTLKSVVDVRLGEGNGQFEAPLSFAAGTDTDFITVADVNGDGKPDLLVINSHPSNYVVSQVTVLLNTSTPGRLSFTDAGTFNDGGFNADFIAADDFTGSGQTDILLNNGYDQHVFLLPGNGDGTFGAAEGIANARHVVAVGDFNGDGLPDLVELQNTNGYYSVGICINDGGGNFAAPTAFYPIGNDPRDFQVADINGDGENDILVSDYFAGGSGITILTNNNNGASFTTTSVAAGAAINSFAVADVNGDGAPDIIAGNYRNDQLSILLGNGDGTFTSPTTMALSNQPATVLIGDVNGDQKPDIVTLVKGYPFGAAFETFLNTTYIPTFAKLVGNVVTVTGTSGSDTINLTTALTPSGTALTITLNGQPSEPYRLTSISDVVVNTLGGDNVVNIGMGSPATYVQGGAGDDTITAANSDNDTLLGGAGADSITGGFGNDQINGQRGNDTLVAGAGNDTLLGGNANDSIIAGGAGDDSANGGAGSDTITGNINPGDTGTATLNGGLGNDSILAGSMDFSTGGGGVDTIVTQGSYAIIDSAGSDAIVLARAPD